MVKSRGGPRGPRAWRDGLGRLKETKNQPQAHQAYRHFRVVVEMVRDDVRVCRRHTHVDGMVGSLDAAARQILDRHQEGDQPVKSYLGQRIARFHRIFPSERPQTSRRRLMLPHRPVAKTRCRHRSLVPWNIAAAARFFGGREIQPNGTWSMFRYAQLLVVAILVAANPFGMAAAPSTLQTRH
ncbi:hypothetical protein GR257_23230 [Rhizobium leguminosarum]|uniref:Uncharacterized protein n=1 Tax=Rhizobium leguminosarum TaxID=384 RepID=A0A7K3VLR2_RHILE|nr:hypothetical protein [Rhizobium leguminosarum]